MRRALSAAAVNVSVTTRGSTWLDLEASGLPAAVRASVHHYNTDAEIDALCAAL